MPLQYTLSKHSVTVVHEGQPFTVKSSAANYTSLAAALEAKDWDRAVQLLTVKEAVKTWSKGDFNLSGGHVTYLGERLPQSLSRRILDLVAKNEAPDAFLRFWRRLQANPSARSVEQLWPFLEKKGIPIHPTGHILAYKGVKTNMRDQHTGTIDNSVGVHNQMPRNKISDDPNVACHFGFHVGALEYAKSFSAVTIICAVDPADVVCIPKDHSHQKMRVCSYTVVGIHGRQLPDFTIDDDDIPVVLVDAGKPVARATTARGKAVKPRRNRDGSKTTRVAAKSTGRRSWTKFNKMDGATLLGQSVADLRAYAQHVQLVGASRYRKLDLVPAIIEARNIISNGKAERAQTVVAEKASRKKATKRRTTKKAASKKAAKKRTTKKR